MHAVMSHSYSTEQVGILVTLCVVIRDVPGWNLGCDAGYR